jgi:hypothetical protein
MKKLKIFRKYSLSIAADSKFFVSKSGKGQKYSQVKEAIT